MERKRSVDHADLPVPPPAEAVPRSSAPGNGVMDRAEYCARVLAGLRGLTRRERKAVRRELEDHMEDHAAALLELGYGEVLAEERTLAAMGDPVEVGRELAKQYPRRWRVVSAVSLALSVLVLFAAFSSRNVAGYLWESVAFRVSPPLEGVYITGVPDVSSYPASLPLQKEMVLEDVRSQEVDIRGTIGDDVLRVYRISVGLQDGKLTAEAAACIYDKVPGGLVALSSFNELWAENQRGEQLQERPRRKGGGHSLMWQIFLQAPVEPGDDHITLRYEWLGESAAIDVPLPEEGLS